VAPELPCPFDEVVNPTSPEPRLGPLNFSKELELGRGPLVELPAIEFSIRGHEPRFVETRLSTAGLPFGDRAAARRGQEPVRLRCPAGSPFQPLARSRRQPCIFPTRPPANTLCRVLVRMKGMRSPCILRPRCAAARGALEFVPSRRRAFLRAHPAKPLFKAASPPGPSIARSAAKPRERLQSRVLSSKRSYR
jgi:hypothetical protein